MNRILSYLFVMLTIMAGGAVRGQSEELAEANKKYQAGDLQGARTLLDGMVTRPEYARSAGVWVLRGFVYKDLYKGTTGNDADGFRDEALGSLFTSTLLDTAKEYSQSSLQAYDFLSKTLYNDAARALNEVNSERALSLYSKYKETVLRLDPDHSFKERDIEFNNALGTVYTKQFNQNREDTVWFERAVELYKRVLKLDSENYGANYNLATLYYNRGVYNIQRISAGTDIPGIERIQEVSRSFFTLALPYMTKAHRMNPKRRETLLGLEGIHYSLLDVEESERYRVLYEQLDQEQTPPPKDK
jgi:tetratricopeptide (TPR) repeat protein